MLYNGVCYKLIDNKWEKCTLEGNEEFFTRAYMSLPYEIDANNFAYEKTKERCGDTPSLKELYNFWIPISKVGYNELKLLFNRIDKMNAIEKAIEGV